MKKSIVPWVLLGAGFTVVALCMIVSLRGKREAKKKGPVIEKPFVIVVPSYNNSLYCEQNLLSILNQRYDNFRVIYIDDDSPDDTFKKVKALIARSSLKDHVTLIHNSESQGSVKNLYQAIQSCKAEEIVVRVDGDDFLAHPFVLKMVNKIYADPDVWMTYGNYLDYPSYEQRPQLCQHFPRSILKNGRFRHYKWVTAHLHTFYAGLFKQIKPEHLMREGQFLSMAGDVAIILPMLEMAAGHFRFIEDVLYLYNRTNPISDHKTNLTLQSTCEGYIRSLPSYPPLKQPPYVATEKRL